ncbi:DUF4150 domain-containing protein [Mesorhizobium opportunistum]|uniref:DUF4150 domain-containing protein n=1 Tax=Mesorhizobium opportunistum TaxID=593909 RepID=A0ABV1YKK3_9HYPH|nr:DUF4150 domain-containing protein [Mesorhizobium sp.]TIN91051.1 MAG: DUF4150 domain-containing protein [Mesorhizobium sp.]TJU96182.1 MAG: DUF4150 domain-containing protein [Mesorhizobium sp.]TJV15487.1 MAG: DUF4150 domain-containing protein [Mesorhizobium sp.]
MAITVFAESMGFFHKGSNGKGIAPGDVCLSPPSPPAGPVPVPYVNMLSSSDLSNGTKSVKIDGEPTAIENSSEISTSTGNEPATQGLGAGVITHKINGKGVFKLWSFTVKAEGKGVDRHGDMMAQNTASDLPNCIDQTAINTFKALLRRKGIAPGPCPSKPYDADVHRPDKDPSPAQKKAVRSKPCWECARDDKRVTRAHWRTERLRKGGPIIRYEDPVHGKDMARGEGHMTHDHQPPLCVAWALGGCNMKLADFKKYFERASRVKPHCEAHYRSQGSQAEAYAAKL